MQSFKKYDRMKYGDETESIIFIHNRYDKKEIVALAVISDWRIETNFQKTSRVKSASLFYALRTR